MKTLTLLIFGFLLFPMSLSAQSVDVLLQKVSEALSAGKDDYAVSLFRQAAGAGTEQTEMYYWTNVEKNSAVAPRFVRELAITRTSGIMTKRIFFIRNGCNTIRKMFQVL